MVELRDLELGAQTAFLLVIPAKAGIHLDLDVALLDEGRIKLDPGFRRDDER